jgi:Domain of unknown function (DUF4386)
MTLRTNARLAGFMFLFYIVIGITHQVLIGKAYGGADGTAATLANMAHHAPLVRASLLVGLLEALAALVLGVTLYALTRDVDRDLAVMAMCCRVGEGIINAASSVRTLALMSLAASATAAGITPQDATATNVLGAVLLKVGPGGVSATCFGLGSTIFSYLFIRGRGIPAPLAWLGLVSSLIWLAFFPLDLVDLVSAPQIKYFVFIPMLLFEVSLAFWLLIKGVATPVRWSPPERLEPTRA